MFYGLTLSDTLTLDKCTQVVAVEKSAHRKVPAFTWSALDRPMRFSLATTQSR
jgi:hypothetical protein